MEPEGSMLHSQGLLNKYILTRINPIPSIDTYFFKIHSNILLQSTLYWKQNILTKVQKKLGAGGIKCFILETCVVV